MYSKSAQLADVTFDSRLLSGRRGPMLVVGLSIATILTIGLGSQITTIAALQTCVAMILLRLFVPDNFIWTEPVKLRLTSDDLSIIRPSGRIIRADWSKFDEVRLKRLNGWLQFAGHHDSWKLTLMNTHKPAISSFINMEADQVLFMFPLELAFDASEPEARELQQTLQAMIETESIT